VILLATSAMHAIATCLQPLQAKRAGFNSPRKHASDPLKAGQKDFASSITFGEGCLHVALALEEFEAVDPTFGHAVAGL
jgi:hypothetical protein